MQILIVPQVRILRIEHKGQTLDWKYGVWAKIPRETTEDQFGPTNDFLASLPEPVQDAMFDNYQHAHTAISEYNEKENIRQAFFHYAPLIVKDITHELLQAWVDAQGPGYIWVEPTPAVRSSKNPPAMTYSEEESRQLSIFCIAAKILAPMIGRYVEEVREKAGGNKAASMHKERQASRLFLATSLVHFPAYQRLQLYLETFAARKQNSVSLAVRFGTASADLDSFLVGLTIVRRLMIATVRTNNNGSIVAFIYKFLEEKINELGSNKEYRPKISNRDKDYGEEESYSDQFRIPEDVEQSIVETNNVYLGEIRPDTQMTHLATYLELTMEEFQQAMAYYHARVFDPHFHITDQIHYPLLGILIRHIAFHKMLDKTEIEPFMLTLAVAAVYARKQGWTDIHDLLLAYRRDVDINTATMSTKNGIVYKRLPDNLAEQISALYRYIPQSQIKTSTNPGKLFIETVMSKVAAYEWTGLNDPSNLRTSLAEFILKRPGPQ